MNDTLFDRMTQQADLAPNRVAVVVREPAGPTKHTWSELSALTARVRGGLRERGVVAGDRVAISLPNGAELIAVLLAVGAESAVAVVLPTPRGRRDGAYVTRLASIWSDCAPVLLVEAAAQIAARESFPELSGLPSARIEQLCAAEPATDRRPGAHALAHPALLQYTSGSTSRPRGVVITDEMIAANCRQAVKVYGDGPDDVAVTWVPLFHDMGLVTAVMRPIFSGFTTVLMQPRDFVTDPLAWLRAVSEHRGTLSSAPDFAYAYCARRLTPADLTELDLSSWRVARDAGELVRSATADAFCRLTRDAGFAEEAFCPSYGMAEATLTVATTTPRERPLRLLVDRAHLTSGDRIVQDAAGRELLSSGPPVQGTLVEVAGGEEGVVGELEVSGPQVAHSYLSGPLRLTGDGALLTGDLGFVVDGHVFVLGRHDDVVVLNGVNLFVQDIADACSGIDGIRAGRIAAFADDRDPSRQSLVVLAEEVPDRATEGTAAAVRARIHRDLGVIVGQVELVPPGGLPVTTSGKVRVAAARDEWLAEPSRSGR